MKVALAQLNPTIGDLEGNAAGILQAARQAVAAGATLMITPELSLCGYPPRDLLLGPGFVAWMDQVLRELARQVPAPLTVLVGTVQWRLEQPQEGGKPLFNTMALIQDQSVHQYFPKRLLPTYDVFDEGRYFQPGTMVNVFTLLDSQVQVGVTICEDLWNDEEFWGQRHYSTDPVAELVSRGVDLVVNTAASPYTLGKPQLRERMLAHGVRRHGYPLAYINQVGGNDDLIFDGRTLVFNRQGELVAQGKAFETDLLLVDFDLQTRDFRWGHRAFQPPAAEAELWAALVLGVRDYSRKCGFERALVGLSGGIDSSLVAVIAQAALGPERVLGVLMPSPFSSDHSIRDALELGRRLGIETTTLAIGELMSAYAQTLEPLFHGLPAGIAEENIQSRIRGNLLMAIANKFGHLLLSTGNKSELAVGYCTLYGDMSGGLAVIADLPKTQVYALSHWLHHQPGSVIPAAVLTKPPSAELRPGQLDQDSLPEYELLDGILERLIQEHQSPAQIVAEGYPAGVVGEVAKLVARAEFKRRQAPPGLKVTDRAFGTGWRMPIASRWSNP